MIDALEIRIGSYLRYTIDEMVMNNKVRLKEDKIVKVDAINYDHLLADQLPASYCINHSSRNYFFPIPLTEEILDKIGKRNLLSSSTEPCWIIDGQLYQLRDYQLQKGLHWFQNYHYFRTGNELNYQP